MPDPAQQKLLDQIARDLIQLMPDGFDAATARFRILTTLGQIEGIASCGDGTTLVFSGFDQSTIDALKQLRQLMYRPGVGTWFSGSITVTRRGASDPQFSYDDEPCWTREVTDDDYAADLQACPRDPGHIPAWLVRRLPVAASGPGGRGLA